MTHIPVMLHEVLAALRPTDGEVYIDGTFGGGGYSRAILEAANCNVIAIDRDRSAIDNGQALAERFKNRLTLIHGRFGDVADLVSIPVNGFVLDLGVSSMQIDQAERGFSFRFDADLDMRMDQSGGLTAADLVNQWEEADIARILYVYGEEKKSRAIAAAIVKRRRTAPFRTTADLADLIRAIVRQNPKDKSDPATRSFQALRIAVNDELGELERALSASIRLLKTGGRLVVVSFHSLEDRIVKNFIKDHSTPSRPSRHMPDTVQQAPLFSVPAKALSPSEDEIKANPRARSARLRVAIRTEGMAA